MTKKQLVKKLELIATQLNDDPEVAHAKADEVLLDYINSKEVKYAWNKIKKWYA